MHIHKQTVNVLSAIATVLVVSLPAGALAQPAESAQEVRVEDALRAIRGAPPPVPPAVVSRSAAGDATIRAFRLKRQLTVDGALGEEIYGEVPSVSNFVQIEPHEGQPATQQTEVWVSFDDDQVYVSVRCWESNLDGMVANEMRRDSRGLEAQDHVALMFDTYYDARNAIVFSVNPLGGRGEGQVTNDREYNRDWNPIWEVKVGRFAGGWTVEAAILFKSIRYRPGRTQVWGFNVRRSNRWKNEISFLKPMPNDLGAAGLQNASLAATLVGIETPRPSLNLDVKPFAVGDLTTDPSAAVPASNDPGGLIGLDVKYALSQSLTADFTVNTDFAQVEADEEQVNLTRFSLFFPEKREFFLENQGVFAFGGAGAGAGGGGDTPRLFYSRRIGLDAGRKVPIGGGGRLTGRLGAFDLGLLNIQTREGPAASTPATNFSVIRVKRDVLRRSSIGVLFANRSHSVVGPGANTSLGFDGTFALHDTVRVNAYWAATRTPGLPGDDTSYSAQFDYSGDRYGARAEHLFVADNFNPEVGFVRRPGMRRSFATARFSPRPASIPAVRKFGWSGAIDYITNADGRLSTREIEADFNVEFENGDAFLFSYGDQFELLEESFPIAGNVTLPVGSYDFASSWFSYTLGSQRRLAGMVFVELGTFFDGEKTSLGFNSGRLELTPQVSLEPGLSVNRVDLLEGSFTTRLMTIRTTYTATPLMFVSALLQYNSSGESFGANFRFRWEYRPGSELFVVYNEQRDTRYRGLAELKNRSVVLKINRLFRF